MHRKNSVIVNKVCKILDIKKEKFYSDLHFLKRNGGDMHLKSI